MESHCRILVVEDDADLRDLMVEILRLEGYVVSEAADGRAALRSLRTVQPDVVLLDVEMPDLDGWKTLERIREVTDVRVMFVTARTDVSDRVRGLEDGADDYLTKPFVRAELVARVGALARRAESGQRARIYEDGRLRLDATAQVVEVDGVEVALTPPEVALLEAFLSHPSQVLSVTQLAEAAFQDGIERRPEQIRVYVGQLRRKIAAAGIELPVETVRGGGYRYRRAS
jgi:DNA-binding response OmpR family regulator